VFEIDFDVLELTENVLAKNAVDLSVHCVADALHILYENAMVFPNSRSGDQCRFSPASVSHEFGALFRRVSAPEVDRIEPRRLSASEARKLRRDGRESTRAASVLFQRSMALREMIFRILSAVAACRKVSQADVETFNAAVRRSNACSLVTPGDGKAAWQWLDKSSDADRLIGKIVRSAVELLTSGDIQRMKQCVADECGWLFIDDSRSRNRRWCEMRTCGSRHKARAYYQRKKADRQRMIGRTHSTD
jgi:predicted RNA-binding Zn ribbon-like protein